MVKRAGLEITLQQKDINHPEFPDDSFDAIVSRNVTWTLSNPWQVYEECRRMLRSGGRLLLFDANWNMPLFDEAMTKRAEVRREECLRQYGDALDSAADITQRISLSGMEDVCFIGYGDEATVLVGPEHITAAAKNCYYR